MSRLCYYERGVNDSEKFVVFGPWRLRVDPGRTSQCYRGIDDVPLEGCGCDPCRNFALVQEEAYPPRAAALFDEIGIDILKPFELSQYGRMPSGRHLYGGWHYLCGSIESGPESRTAELHRIDLTFEISITKVSDAREPFPRSDCLQLDFYTEVPWKLNGEEPD